MITLAPQYQQLKSIYLKRVYIIWTHFFQTFEGRTIAVARRLTCQVRQSVKVITGYLPEGYQPDAVRERLVHARQFSEDLYGSFKGVMSLFQYN